MAENDGKESSKSPRPQSHWSGLADEGVAFLTDEQIQAEIQKRNRKNDLIRLCKGVGFTLAIAAGLFGYLLKANSEADDRKAEAIRAVIAEKKAWAIKVNTGIMEVRRTRELIRRDCERGKAPSAYEQKKMRFLALDRFVDSNIGIDEVYGKEVYNSLGEFATFDESIPNVCSKQSPSDNAWRNRQRKLNELFRESIRKDRDKLDELGNGIFNNF